MSNRERNPKIPSNAPKLDEEITGKTWDEIHDDIQDGLEDIDEKTRRDQQYFPPRNLPSNAPKFEDVEDEAEKLSRKRKGEQP
jgi:hypothetical protein